MKELPTNLRKLAGSFFLSEKFKLYVIIKNMLHFFIICWSFNYVLMISFFIFVVLLYIRCILIKYQA